MQTMEQKLAMLMRNEISRKVFKELPPLTSYDSLRVPINHAGLVDRHISSSRTAIVYIVHNTTARKAVEICENGEVFVSSGSLLGSKGWGDSPASPSQVGWKKVGTLADPSIIEIVRKEVLDLPETNG